MPKRIPGVVLVLIILFALVACGGNGPIICNSPSSAICKCDSGACPALINAYVYASGINGQISVFPVDPTTGELAAATSTTSGPPVSLGMAALNNQFLYASSDPSQSGGSSSAPSIDAWSVNPNTGALTPLQGSPFALPPLSLAGGLAIDSAASVLYVGDANGIDAFKIDPAGALTPLAGSPFASGDILADLAVAIDSQNRFLFAADNAPPGYVDAFAIDSSSGALAKVPGSPFAVSGGAGNSQPIVGIVVDTSGKFVYAVLEGTNQIAGFSITASSGALTPVPGPPVVTGKGPGALITANNFLYVSNLLDGTLSAYKIDSSSGVLTPLLGSPFAIHAVALATDPGGSFLYTTVGSMDSYKINSDGTLTQIGLQLPYTGASMLAYVQ